ILTTAANDVVRPVHERMPVLLDAGDFAAWLDCAATVQELKALLRPYAGDDLQAVAVSPRVNNARHEGPRCPGPADEPPGGWGGEGGATLPAGSLVDEPHNRRHRAAGRWASLPRPMPTVAQSPWQV